MASTSITTCDDDLVLPIEDESELICASGASFLDRSVFCFPIEEDSELMSAGSFLAELGLDCLPMEDDSELKSGFDRGDMVGSDSALGE